MFSVCFQSDQDLLTDTRTKIKKNSHSSHARPKTMTSDQLVGIADYMGASLEVNDNHTLHMYIKYMYNRCTCAMLNSKHTNWVVTYIKTRQTDVIVEETKYDLYKT